MPDPEPDPVPDSPLTPAQDDAVRTLLASARHTGATPPDVVARLETTLASLAEERRSAPAGSAPVAPVVTLASRRRRTAASVLLAAAAVVVFGVGIGEVLPLTDGGGESTSDSAGTAGPAAEAPEAGEAGEDKLLGAQSDRAAGAESAGRARGEAALTGDTALEPQVRALRSAGAAATFSTLRGCALPAAGPGRRVSVTYDGQPGALVFRAPVGSTQRVDLFLCGRQDALRSVRLPRS